MATHASTMDTHTGQLHTGAATAPPTGHEGGLHTAGAGAAPAKRGMFGGGRNKEVAVGVDSGRRRGGFAVNTGARIGLILAQLLTAIAFLVVLGGLSALQKRANDIELLPGQGGVYAEAFQSGGQRPYPGQGKYQFGLQWWILMFEIVIFLIIAVLIIMPRHLMRGKHIAMAFLVYVLVFTTLQIDSLLWFKRGSVLVTTALGSQNVSTVNFFGKRRIQATLAGTIMGAIANCLSIIFLGLLREDRGHNRGAVAGNKRVGHEGTAGEQGVATAV